ncbi:nucleoside monophosphate kinase [Patescibacteria group bacterium]|nr:nucleoside monophosphate kinase [Patescibacteria group bacterium]
MTPQTFIFIGRSGCGKGTQVKLLDAYLKTQDPSTPIYHLETGDRFRKFIASDGYTNSIAKEIMISGKRQPDFLAVWMWANTFVEDLKGGEHMILDGISRSLPEAKILENAFEFYKREKIYIVYINVGRAWSEKHLLARGRADDVSKDIKERLDWYERDVVPAVEYFKTNERYTFLDINGEQPIEKVHEDIIQNIFHVND